MPSCQSWNGAELVQRSIPRYCGDLSFFHSKCTWFIFFHGETSAQQPTNGAIKEILLFTASVLLYCCDLLLSIAFFHFTANPSANRAPRGLDCAWEMSFWQITFSFQQKMVEHIDFYIYIYLKLHWVVLKADLFTEFIVGCSADRWGVCCFLPKQWSKNSLKSISDYKNNYHICPPQYC